METISRTSYEYPENVGSPQIFDNLDSLTTISGHKEARWMSTREQEGDYWARLWRRGFRGQSTGALAEQRVLILL